MVVFIVVAYRWGQRELHSYTLGAFSEADLAIECAISHTKYRAGKYACTVEACTINNFDNDAEAYIEEIFKTESMGGKDMREELLIRNFPKTGILEFEVIKPINNLEIVGQKLILNIMGEYSPANSNRGYSLLHLLQRPDNYRVSRIVQNSKPYYISNQ
mgnify:CR=1 FL=1